VAYEVIPQHLSIKAMRSSGYRDAAHAIAELIDNSIEAGQAIKGQRTEVEVLCIDQQQFVNERARKRIHQIAVYDNACGMDEETLRIALQFGNGTHLETDRQKGMGKFGMGLPNASISQCRHVDVWTWQEGKCLYSFLDIGEIEKGRMKEVPKPKSSTVPQRWIRLVRDTLGEHGTLVVWSELDRVAWKQSSALLKNAEFLIGRIYRYFINDHRARIRLAAFDENGKSLENVIDKDVRPNDPLYLMSGTSAPSPYDKTPAFDLTQQPEIIEVTHQGGKHKVEITYSICKPEAREAGGSSAIGRHVAKNTGVSVVRAGRELEMNHSFEISYDPRERWWGIEVRFGSELDEIFGVTNNKQAATRFQLMDFDDDAAAEGMSTADYRQMLEDSEDPRLAIYEVSKRISSTLRTLREQISRMKEGSRKVKEGVPGTESAEGIATRATRERREKLGKTGRSDVDEALPPQQRAAVLGEELEAEGVPTEQAREIAVSYVNANLKFHFQTADIPGPAVFDIRSKAGTIIITINRRHPAHDHLFELLRNKSAEADPRTLTALKLLLTAWARMEDEAGDQRRQDLEDVRMEWGRIARDFLQQGE
jgi:hypothetical protein